MSDFIALIRLVIDLLLSPNVFCGLGFIAGTSGCQESIAKLEKSVDDLEKIIEAKFGDNESTGEKLEKSVGTV